MATLLPLPETTWFDQNGVPLAGGSVYFYVPNTTTPKDTWQDAAGTTLNTNPVVLDSAGRAIVYGTGSYRQQVYDASRNLIWDQITADTAVGGLAWGGISTGTPNAQDIAVSSFSQQDGQQISFIVGAGLTNTGPTTISPGGASGIAVLKNTLNGPTSLTGGELVAGNTVTLIYFSTNGSFQLASYPIPIIPLANAVTNAMLAQAPANTLKGNNTAATANEADLTGAQATALLSAFVGDSGAGGTKGLVPAPAATQGAAKAYLCADGTWEGAPLGAVDHWGLPTRALGTTYQNLTGRPIQVSVTVNCPSSTNATFQVSTDGTNWTSINQIATGGGAAVQGAMGGIIPPNVYYRVLNSGGTLVMWAELT